VFGAIKMTAKGTSFFGKLANASEREYLKATRVGEYWFVPTIELM
jgi:hypothetical protein